MDRLKDGENVDSQALQPNKGEQVNVGQSYEGKQQDIVKELQNFETIRDGGFE